MSRTYSRTWPGSLVRETADTSPVTLAARYDTDDPFALSLDFTMGGVTQVWTVARDLAADALTAGEWVGVGDIQLWNVEGCLCILLDSDDGHAFIITGPDVLARFLDATFRYVPRGTEQVPDVEFEALLAGGAA